MRILNNFSILNNYSVEGLKEDCLIIQQLTLSFQELYAHKKSSEKVLLIACHLN